MLQSYNGIANAATTNTGLNHQFKRIKYCNQQKGVMQFYSDIMRM
jgi:hypothetical protein